MVGGRQGGLGVSKRVRKCNKKKYTTPYATHSQMLGIV